MHTVTNIQAHMFWQNTDDECFITESLAYGNAYSDCKDVEDTECKGGHISSDDESAP